MFVYVVGFTAGVFKIGQTSNLAKRFNREPEQVIAKIPAPDPESNEKSLHRLFDAVRIGRSERFRLTARDLELVGTLARLENPWPTIESLSSKVSHKSLTCQHCNKSWTPRVKEPVQCPRCKRVDWRKPSAAA